MTSPLENYKDYYTFEDWQIKLLDKYFGDFWSQLYLWLMVIAVITAMIAIVWILIEVLKAFMGKSTSRTRMKIASMLLIISMLIGTGSGFALYTSLSKLFTLDTIMESSETSGTTTAGGSR